MVIYKSYLRLLMIIFEKQPYDKKIIIKMYRVLSLSFSH